MTIAKLVANLLAQIAPVALVKRIMPTADATQPFTLADTSDKPWMNADAIELTEQDFA